MARLSTYPNDNSISGEDLLTGSNFVSLNTYETKNFKINELTEYVQGQISISPSNSTLKANGGIVTEVINSTNSLAIDLSATSITGQLANSDLANSSITINGTAVALGGTITIGEVTEVTAGTYLSGGGTGGTVTLNHDDTERTNSTTTASPAYGASFTAIDSLTTNTTGHVTAVNTKTITLPASDNTTYTVEAVASTNDSIIRLIDSDSNNDDIKLIAGDNISLSTNEENDTITINSQAFGTVFTVATEALMIAATTTGGDIVIRTDVSKTFIHNGGTVGDVTDFSELQFSGINSITLTEGDGIDLSRTTLTNANNDLTITNDLATTTVRGGIQIGYTESGKNYPVELDSEKAYVNVPWVNTTYDVMGAGDPPDYSAGLVLEGNGTHGDAFLRKDGTWEVPVDTDTTYSTVTTSAAGLAPQLPDPHGGKFLKADGTWEVPAYISDTNTQNTYSVNIPESTTKISLTGTIPEGANTTEDIEFVGSGATTVTRTNANKFTISSTDTNTDTNTQNTTTLSFVEEDNGASTPVATGNIILRNTTGGAGSGADDIKLNAGANITLTHTDADNITIASEDTTNWNFKVDSGTAENISEGNTITFSGGDNVTLTQNGKTISVAASVPFSSLTTNTNTNANTPHKATLSAAGVLNIPQAPTYTLDVDQSSQGNNNNPLITLDASSSTDDSIQISGGDLITVTRAAAGEIEISSTAASTAVFEQAYATGSPSAPGGLVYHYGTKGLVPAPPSSTYTNKDKYYLTSNETWSIPTGSGVIAETVAFGDATTNNTPLTASINSRTLTLTSKKYKGGNLVGYVPNGGTSSTYLRGDGQWASIGSQFQGTWDASVLIGGGGGNPYLIPPPSPYSSGNSNGDFYIVSVAGSATPNGSNTTPNSWGIGDTVIWSGSSTNGSWTRVPATASGVNSVNTTDGTYINLTPNSASTGSVTVTADLSAAATGSSSTATKFLTKENKWQTPSYTTNTNTQLSTEAVQDIVGAMVANNTETNITVTYQDSNGTIDFEATNTTYSVQDGELSQNNFTNALKTKLDGIEAGAEVNQTIAAIKTGIETGNGKLVPDQGTAGHFLKHDGTFGLPSYTNDTNLSNEEVQDIVGGMVSGNTESGITVTYTDGGVGAGKLDFVVASQTANDFTNALKTKLDNLNTDTGTPAILSNGTTPSLNTNISAAEIRNLIGAGTGSGTLTAEADTLATVTGRGATTTTASTFSGGLNSTGVFSSGGTGVNAYSYFNGNSNTGTNNAPPPSTFTHGLALAWNNSGGSREFEHWWATGADIGNNATGRNSNKISYMSWFNRYCPTGGTTVDTRMAKWYGSGEFELLDMATLPGGGATPTFSTPYIRLPLVAGTSGKILARKSGSTRDTEWITPFSGSYTDLTNKPTIPTNNNQLTNGAGYITSFDITSQTDSKYLRSDADDTSSGSLTVKSYKFNGNITNPTNTTATIYDQSSVGLTVSSHNFSIRNYNSSSMVESARFTTSSLTVIGDVVAFGSPSDVTLKENIKPIESALDKAIKLQGVTFDWKESDSILDIKQDIGFIAQDVQKVLPELVRKNENGKLSLRHQGITPILLEAIKELKAEIEELKLNKCNCNK